MHIQKDMNMQKPPRPGYLDIRTPIHTIGVAPDHIIPAPLTSNDNRAGPIGHGVSTYNQNQLKVQTTSKALDQDYQTKVSQLSQSLEAELAATRSEGSTAPLPPVQSITRELGVLNTLTHRKTVELQNKTVTANAFYGGDPFNRHINDFMKKATTLEKWPGPNGIAMQALVQSLQAANDVRLLTQTLQLLNQRTADVQNFLRVVQANEEAQRAAAELVRINEEAAARAQEQARLAALENARRVAAEQEAKFAAAQVQDPSSLKGLELHWWTIATLEKHRAIEKDLAARRAALANEKEQARVAAQAAAQQVAAERARLEAQAESKRQAEQLRVEMQQAERKAQDLARQQSVLAEKAKAEAEAERFRLEQQKKAQSEERDHRRQQSLLAEQAVYQRQAERARLERHQQAIEEAQALTRQQAQLEALAEPQRRAETEARWQNPTFANAGSTAAFGPAFTGTAGTIGTSPATSLALRAALRTAVSAVTATLATVTAPVLVGFAGLLVPSRLGNGDLFSVSVPLSELAPFPTADLYELAVTGGAVDLPLTLGSKTIGNKVEIVVVATDGVTVPASVPVNLAHFDARKNVYVSGSTVANGPIITWTPLVDPQTPSTDFPLTETDLPIYEGATVTPNTGRVDPFPELDLYGFGGFITVFPIDSGLPPIFTLFRDRRQDPGIASGNGEFVSGIWLGTRSRSGGAPIPKQIADKLREREFSNFRAFREALWRAVSDDLELATQFTANNVQEISNGRAPFSRKADRLGGQVKLELHHVKHVSKDGEIFDMDNIRIVTPKRHSEIHKGDK
jgi:hypothetical protein